MKSKIAVIFFLMLSPKSFSQDHRGALAELIYLENKIPIERGIFETLLQTDRFFSSIEVRCKGTVLFEKSFSKRKSVSLRFLPPTYRCPFEFWVKTEEGWQKLKTQKLISPYNSILQLSSNKKEGVSQFFWGTSSYSVGDSGGFSFPTLFNDLGEVLFVAPSRGNLALQDENLIVQSDQGFNRYSVKEGGGFVKFKGMKMTQGHLFSNGPFWVTSKCHFSHGPYPYKIFRFSRFLRFLAGLIRPLSYSADRVLTKEGLLYDSKSELLKEMESLRYPDFYEKIYENETFLKAMNKLSGRKVHNQCNVVGTSITKVESNSGSVFVLLSSLKRLRDIGNKRNFILNESFFVESFESNLDLLVKGDKVFLLTAIRDQSQFRFLLQEGRIRGDHIEKISDNLLQTESLFPEARFVVGNKTENYRIVTGVGFDELLKVFSSEDFQKIIEFNGGRSSLKVFGVDLFEVESTFFFEVLDENRKKI